MPGTNEPADTAVTGKSAGSTGTWFYAVDGQQVGPVGFGQLQEMGKSHRLRRSDLVWAATMPNWTPAGQMPGIFSLSDADAQLRPPPLTGAVLQTAANPMTPVAPVGSAAGPVSAGTPSVPLSSYRHTGIRKFIFLRGPGYWKPTAAYWVLYYVGVISRRLLVGHFILGLINGWAKDSKQQWHNLELQRAVRGN